ncbi:hypothetical protein OQA88_784 [Cercophora sp. LCS_1]
MLRRFGGRLVDVPQTDQRIFCNILSRSWTSFPLLTSDSLSLSTKLTRSISSPRALLASTEAPEKPLSTASGDDASELSWTPEVERKLVRKIDLCLLPMLWLMNLLSWMNRANLGNASIAGLTKDLESSSTQYSMAVVTFYFGYIFWAPISNLILILVRIRPSIYLPTVMLLWGVVTCGISAAKTYPKFFVIELGKRSSPFLTSAQLGGIFGGITAGALMANLEGVHGIRGWQWLLIVEGVVTNGVAIIAIFFLPDFPGTCRKLNEVEREIAVARLKRVGMRTKSEEEGKLALKATIVGGGGLKEWKTYALGLGSSMRSGSMTLTYFYPLLVKGLGYTDPIKAQCMTAPIWAVAFAFTMVAGFGSDLVPLYRGLIITAICGFVVLLAFMTAGIWVTYSQILAYIGDIIGDVQPDIRAFSIGTTTMAAQAGYIYGAYFFPTENAPRHILGFGMVTVLKESQDPEVARVYVIRRPLDVPFTPTRRTDAPRNVAVHSGLLLVDNNGKATIAERMAEPEGAVFRNVDFKVTRTNKDQKYEVVVTSDGKEWTKQLRGEAVPGTVTKNQVKNILNEVVSAAEYRVGGPNCHRAQEEVRRRLGLTVPPDGLLATFINGVASSVESAYMSSTSGVSSVLSALPTSSTSSASPASSTSSSANPTFSITAGIPGK